MPPCEATCGVVVGDVARADLGELVVALVHLARHPLQRAHHPFDLDHHRRQQVRDAVVAGQLDPLGVDQDQAQVVGGVVQQQAAQDGVDAHRLAGAGGAGDQQVRHGVQVGDLGCPATSLPSAKRSGDLLRVKTSLSITSRSATSAISSLGTSMPT